MKKILATTLAMFVLASFGVVLAQVEANHDVIISIPEVVSIRVVPTNDALDPDVVFDYATNQAAYIAVLESVAGAGWLPATTQNLGDVEVLAIGTDWEVTVSTTGAFTNTLLGFADVRVTPAAGDSFTQFFLDTTTEIAAGGATNWTSLGISGDDFELRVDGTERDGSDTINVIYTITNL